MRFKKIVNTISISKDIIEQCIHEGDIVLDATLGNGNDTLELRRRVGSSGRVYGFDIQEIAIENTRKLLSEYGFLDNVTLIKDDHRNIDQYIKEPLDLVIYNLGYLPKGDKSIRTNSSSTVDSVSKSLEMLKGNGLLIIISYIGHPGGLEEKEALELFMSNLNQKKFNVLKHEFINQQNNPPLIYIIEKAFFT